MRDDLADPPSTSNLVVYVQARMSSRRFPGKVLAPFQGQPLIHGVLAAIEGALPGYERVVLTSDDHSDDPLASYLESSAVAVFRGPLENVFERFRRCTARYPADWILRINADSPLLSAEMLRAVVARAQESLCDLVTTIHPRTWPKGQNAELIRTGALLSVNPQALSSEEAQHVTPYFYRNASAFRIVNVASGDPRLAAVDLAVDTVEDLHYLERISNDTVGDLLAGRLSYDEFRSTHACSGLQS